MTHATADLLQTVKYHQCVRVCVARAEKTNFATFLETKKINSQERNIVN